MEAYASKIYNIPGNVSISIPQDDRIKSPDFKIRKTRNDKRGQRESEDQALRGGVFAQQKLVDFVVIYVEAMTDYIIRFGNNFGVTSFVDGRPINCIFGCRCSRYVDF